LGKLPSKENDPPTGPKNPYIPMGMGGAEQAGRPNVRCLSLLQSWLGKRNSAAAGT